MSVLKHLRSLSGMEFYKNAIKIRRELTIWMLKDFGAKRNYRSVRQVIKHVTPDEQKVIDHIFGKYGRTSSGTYRGEYPRWFIDFERINVSRNLQRMVRCITSANSIYPKTQAEKDLRRCLQDRAIGECYVLYQEIQYITSLFPQDLNRFVYLLDDLEREVLLLKGWRQSDNLSLELCTVLFALIRKIFMTVNERPVAHGNEFVLKTPDIHGRESKYFCAFSD